MYINVNYWPLGGYLSKWNTIGLYSIDLYTIPRHYAFEMWLWTQKMRWSVAPANHIDPSRINFFQLHRSSCSCYGEVGKPKGALSRGAGKGCSTILNAGQFPWNSSMPPNFPYVSNKNPNNSTITWPGLDPVMAPCEKTHRRRRTPAISGSKPSSGWWTHLNVG